MKYSLLAAMVKTQKQAHSTILNELEQIRKQDFTFSSGKILGSMCTQPHPIAKKAYMKFLATNPGDPELFPGTRHIENKLIDFHKTLLHAPKNSQGLIVSGGTEANITAIWLAKHLSKNRTLLIPKSAHFSFQKISTLMDVKLLPISLTKEYIMDITQLKQQIKKGIMGVVAVAGSTELGTIDPIPEISDLCVDEHIFLHVDAAFGGFIIPFLKTKNPKIPSFDFSLPGVSTLSVDAHKMGYSAIPLGILLLREKKWLESISVRSPCISSKTQTGILGTRSGGPIAAAYAVIQYLGVEGYSKLIQKCMNTTGYTAKKIEQMGLSLILPPTMNVLGIYLKHLDTIVDELAKKGWKVNKIDHLSCIRIVLMPHVTRKSINEFLPIFKEVCQQVGEI